MMGGSTKRGPGSPSKHEMQAMSTRRPGVHRPYLARGPPPFPVASMP